MILIVVLGIIGLLIWYYFIRSRHPAEDLDGPTAVPFFGTMLVFRHGIEVGFKQFNKWCEIYYPIFRTWQGSIPVVHPLDPADVEMILSSSQHITKSHDYNFLRKWLGTSLLIATGSKWHARRKLITPAFHFKILEEFIPIFSYNSKIFITKLRKYLDNQEGVNIVPLIAYCALDVICGFTSFTLFLRSDASTKQITPAECERKRKSCASYIVKLLESRLNINCTLYIVLTETAMGTRINAQEETTSSPYTSAVYEINEIILQRALRPWLYPDWIFSRTATGKRHDECINTLHSFTKKVIRERREERKSILKNNDEIDANDIGIKKKTAFLDLLLKASEEQGGLTDDDIREEVDTFMFEGHDTTTMAMSWASFFLGTYPDIQDKCVEELKEIFGESNRSPTMKDLNNMNYLERVLKETMRLRPSVPFVARQLDKNLKLKGRREFPAGTKISIRIYEIHRNPFIYVNPEKFDPDRFLPENCVGRHPYAYIPFSAGPRNCIGQKFAMLEMKSLLSTLLRTFRLETCDPKRDYTAIPDIILRPKNGIHLRLFNRDQF